MRGTWIRGLVAAWVLVFAVGFAAPVAAQGGTISAEDEAHMRFELGRRYYEAGRFAEAAREFEESNRLAPHDELLYNLYLAYRDSGDDVHAAATLRRFLATPGVGDRRAQLEARLAVIEARIPATATTSETPTDTATDATTEATGEATLDGTPPVQGTTTPSSGGGGLGVAPWVLLGAGAVLVVASVVTGLFALDARSTLAGMCPTVTTCADGYEDARSRGAALATTTDVLWVTGGVAIATGIVLAIIDSTTPHDEGTPTAGLACDSNGCMVAASGRF